MKSLNKFVACTLILPMGVLVGAACSDDDGRDSVAQQTQPDTANDRRLMSDQDQDRDRMQAERRSASDSRTGMSGTGQDSTFMDTAPDNAIHLDTVVGSTLHLRSDNEEVGTIDDLIIDESGQVVAVVVGVGGTLGLGDHPVAISWDSVERTMDEDRDEHRFSVDATEDELRNAPAYDQGGTGSGAGRSRTN